MSERPISPLEQHPLVVGMFPPAQQNETTALSDDVRDRGRLLLPILLYENHIIDGWQRYLACLEHGVEPVFQTWEGTADQLPRDVLALKLTRQYLTSSQRATIAVKLLPGLQQAAAARKLKGKKADLTQNAGGAGKHSGEATEQAAKLVRTNRDYVAMAKQLSVFDPQLFEQVWRGSITIPDAMKRVTADLGSLRESAPQLHRQVKGGVLTLPAAMDRLKKKRSRIRPTTARQTTGDNNEPASSVPPPALPTGSALDQAWDDAPLHDRLLFLGRPDVAAAVRDLRKSSATAVLPARRNG